MLNVSNNHIELKSSLEMSKITPFFNLMGAKIGQNGIMTLFGIDFGGGGILKKRKNIYEVNAFDLLFHLV